MASIFDKYVKRNVLVVGKTGSGLSTVANQILGKDMFDIHPVAAPRKIYTAKPAKSSNYFCCEGVHYDLSVIDTIGMYSSSHYLLSNEKIMEQTIAGVNSLMKTLHLVVFVIKEGRFTQEEKQTFDVIHKSARYCFKLNAISLMVITGCEGQDKNQVIRKYKEDPATKEIFQKMWQGVTAVGFPDLSQYRGRLKEMYAQEVRQDQTKLRKIVCNASIGLCVEDAFK